MSVNLAKKPAPKQGKLFETKTQKGLLLSIIRLEDNCRKAACTLRLAEGKQVMFCQNALTKLENRLAELDDLFVEAFGYTPKDDPSYNGVWNYYQATK